VKKPWLFISVITVVLLLVSAAFLFIAGKGEEQAEPSATTPEITSEISADDAAGTRLNDQEQIKEALLEKNKWNSEDVEVSISENDGVYARGMVGPVGGGPGGGMWFAKNVDGTWQIVWDGNGSIMCDALEAYPDFPTDMIPECYDPVTGEMTTR
jgi:hypothetical protein